MSLNSEITRLQTAKATLKTKLNARNDNQHQIDDETIDEYGDFVDSIPQGGGIDWSEIGYTSEPYVISYGYDYSKTIYDNWDSSQSSFYNKFVNDNKLIFMPLVETSNGTNFESMFNYCQALTTIPQLDTSSGTNFNSMFRNCTSLITVQQLNTSNGTNFNAMFNNCASLTTVPQLDTSKGTNFNNMFYNCISLTTIQQLNTSNGTNFSNVFNNCISLTTIPQLDTSKGASFNSMFRNCTLLATFGGLKNIGQAYSTGQSANFSNYTLDLSSCSSLTHDSLMNVINGLYDIATAGCNTQQLVLGSTNLAKLTAEEIAIATNRGWSIS